MLQSYEDILVTITVLLRHCHNTDINDGYRLLADCVPGGLGQTCGCVAKPAWWDEIGVPRFAPHHPKWCVDLQANEVALLEVACQACDRRFSVQMSSTRHPHDDVGIRASLSWRLRSVANGITTPPHYGDPPFHDGCATGVTMNCYDLRVLEFWRRPWDRPHDWVRVPELEIELPDLTDPDRVGVL